MCVHFVTKLPQGKSYVNETLTGVRDNVYWLHNSDPPLSDEQFQKLVDSAIDYSKHTEDFDWELPEPKSDFRLGIAIILTAAFITYGGLYLIWRLAH